MTSPLQRFAAPLLFVLLLNLPGSRASGSPAVTLFEDTFTGGIPGWTAVQPAGGAYLEGPMLWIYDQATDSYSEQSNIYTDGSGGSPTRIAVMLINDTVAPTNFTYTARLTAGDDDGFGLIWGSEGASQFYRVSFAWQNRTGVWPPVGWTVDRMTNGGFTDLFGPDGSFVPTRGQPFDVTIAVNNGNLTLSLVDDPLGAAIPITLVNTQPLPSAPSGRVGIFSWGMGGNNPRAFRVQNPVLTPTPLAGNPANVLSNWSFVVTPREDGSTEINSGGTEPIWAQGLGLNGDMGTMIQNSDSYNTVDNVAAGTTNFIAPTAVAGDANWSNYVVSARFVSADNDGFGFVLRYQDDQNFYRVAFRNQANATAGIRRGLTVQKNINLVFDQVYSNGVSGFVPPINVPFEVYAAISGSRLQVVAINNPDGMPLTAGTAGGTATPTASASGAIDFDSSTLVPGSLDTGKIGVFSWAQYGDNNLPNNTAPDYGSGVDWIRVHQVNGQALIVSSLYGTPTPEVGLNDLPSGGTVTASVNSPVASAPGVRQVAIGWSGLGSVPSAGTNNQVEFTLDSFSSITWNWQTQFAFDAAAGAGGTVSSSAGAWVPAGAPVAIAALPNAGQMFTGWSGDSASTETNLVFTMTQPISLQANFAADSDSDQLPDPWETQYFGNLAQTGAADADGDGIVNRDEYLRGSNPAFAESVAISDGLSSQWVNTQRDPVLSGQLVVMDFGSGFRGAFDNSNDFRYANDTNFVSTNLLADFVSFQSPRVIVRPELWNDDWSTNFTLSAEFSVGDDDGNCLYFRYVDEQNWYRVTITGEASSQPIRPVQGVTVQKRVNGLYSEVPGGYNPGIWTDPADTVGFKRLKVTLNATQETFELKVMGWNALLPTPGFDPSSEQVLLFSDPDHPRGRVGFGFWGMNGFGSSQNATNGNPIPSGGFIDNIIVTAGGSNVLTETWETTALTNQFPVGWSNPYAGLGAGSFEGNWQVTAHGTIAQFGGVALATTGTAGAPNAQVDTPLLLAPDPAATNYVLQFGFHAFDDDGVGFVYDYQDTNNYSRVLFVAEATAAGRVPQGLSISRKSNGVWTDIVAGDTGYLYRPGRPFDVEFANNSGSYALVVREPDNPATLARWQWTAPASMGASRFGISEWGSVDMHVLYARALALPSASQPGGDLEITDVRVTGDNVVIEISNPAGVSYDVLRASQAEGPYLPVATNQTAAQYTEPVQPQNAFYRLRVTP